MRSLASPVGFSFAPLAVELFTCVGMRARSLSSVFSAGVPLLGAGLAPFCSDAGVGCNGDKGSADRWALPATTVVDSACPADTALETRDDAVAVAVPAV